jgi:hypothetical protein
MADELFVKYAALYVFPTIRLTVFRKKRLIKILLEYDPNSKVSLEGWRGRGSGYIFSRFVSIFDCSESILL